MKNTSLVAAALALLTGAAAADDMEKGRALAAKVCVACHGADGNSTDPAYPKLAGHHADYIVRQLNEFIGGRRKSDAMVGIITTIDPEDFKALGAWFEAQKPSPGKAADPETAEAGRKIYADGDEEKGLPACAGCHKEDATGTKRFPRLAGQHREYLIKEMMDFRNEVRNNEAGRAMREVAKRMTEEEIKAVAAYLAGL